MGMRWRRRMWPPIALPNSTTITARDQSAVPLLWTTVMERRLLLMLLWLLVLQWRLMERRRKRKYWCSWRSSIAQMYRNGIGWIIAQIITEWLNFC